jgi:hypothetical protein
MPNLEDPSLRISTGIGTTHPLAVSVTDRAAWGAMWHPGLVLGWKSDMFAVAEPSETADHFLASHGGYSSLHELCEANDRFEVDSIMHEYVG